MSFFLTRGRDVNGKRGGDESGEEKSQSENCMEKIYFK